MSGSTRWLVGVVAVVAVIVVIGVAAAAMSKPRAYPADSPEYAVQQYVQAVADRDATKAFTYLSSELLDRCDTMPREAVTGRGRSNVRATLEETTIKGDTATVRVQITEVFGDAPFGGGESTQSLIFYLARTSAGWQFTDAPWPLYCPPKPVR
jgi:hypothetical protein